MPHAQSSPVQIPRHLSEPHAVQEIVAVQARRTAKIPSILAERVIRLHSMIQMVEMPTLSPATMTLESLLCQPPPSLSQLLSTAELLPAI
jgi:hypothetical protein